MRVSLSGKNEATQPLATVSDPSANLWLSLIILLSAIACAPEQLEVYASVRNGSTTIQWQAVTINPKDQPWLLFDDAENWPALQLTSQAHSIDNEPVLIATGNPQEQAYDRIYLNAQKITENEQEILDILEPIAYDFEHRISAPQRILVTCSIEDAPQGRGLFVINAERMRF